MLGRVRIDASTFLPATLTGFVFGIAALVAAPATATADDVVQAPGYCPSIARSCSDGCGAYPDRIKDVRINRTGDHLQFIVVARAYPKKYCDQTTCTPQAGFMRRFRDSCG